jgi:uncharacterized protein YutE (UPF0331/DUF86 family)
MFAGRGHGRITTMAEEKSIQVYFDAMPNWLKMSGKARDDTARQVIERMQARIAEEKDQIIGRYAKLPPLIIHMGPHVELLNQARSLFIEAYFYPCVAMCGIVAERILLDLFAKTLAAKVGDKVVSVPEAARRALENAGAKEILHFLAHTGALDKSIVTPLQELANLRNTYAHAAGKNPEADAEKAIYLLHQLVEATVSIFKDYYVDKGKFFPKVVAAARVDEGVSGAGGKK